jgi:hypothetical protein
LTYYVDMSLNYVDADLYNMSGNLTRYERETMTPL